MSKFIYKCVPVPTIIGTGTKGKSFHQQAVEDYERIINDAATGGWELIQIDRISSSQQPGCLGGLLGGKAEIVTFKVMIFKREE